MTGPSIPQIQGLDDTLGPALESLTDSIGTLLNPTAKYDQQLKAAFLQKPELMQKFVDIEKANPGTLRAFGFGEGATNLLSGMMESIDSLKNRVIQPEVARALSAGTARRTLASKEATGLTPGQLSADRLHQWLNDGGLDLIKTDPEAFDLGIRAIMDLPSKAQQKEDKLKLGALSNDDLKSLTPNEIVQKIMAGQLKTSQLSSGLLNPQTAGGVKFALQMWAQKMNEDLRKELRKQGLDEHNNSVARLKLTAAIQQRAAAGFIGGLEAHYQSIWGEQLGDTAAPQAEVEAVQQFQNDAGVTVRLKQQQNMVKTIQPMIDAIQLRKKGQKPITEGLARLKINEINKVLRDAGVPWQARYDVERHWFSPNRPQIVFTNKNGQVTDDPSVLVSDLPALNAVPRNSKPAVLSGDERRVQAWLKTLTTEQRDSIIPTMYDAEEKAGGDGSRTEAIVDGVDPDEAEQGAE